MSTGGHKTSAIARPRTTVERPAADVDQTRFSDFTRPIRADQQLVVKKSNRWLLSLFALAILAALVAAMFVLPVQAWLKQKDDIAVKQHKLDVLAHANAALTEEIGRLNTTDGAIEAVREELGLVPVGEERISILPSVAPTVLPPGWPYDLVSSIIRVRATVVSDQQASTAVVDAPGPAVTTLAGTVVSVP